MKKKRNRLLTLLLAFAILLTGCRVMSTSADDQADGSETEVGDGQIREDTDDRDPAQICQAFLDAYADRDSETVGSLLTGSGSPYSFGELTALLARNMTAELGKGETAEDYFVIPATIHNVDMAAVLEELPENIANTEEAQAWLAEAFAADDVPMKDYEVQVYLILQDGAWKVEMTTDLADALLGGYFTLMQEPAVEGEQ